MADDSVYFCEACGASHNNPKTIAVCASCGARGTIKVRPAFKTEPEAQQETCEVCGGNHATRDARGEVCSNGMEGGKFSLPSDTKRTVQA